MDKKYTHEEKQKLADKISTIKRKKDLVKILDIMSKDKISVTENNNGLFMFFHKLEDKTYHEIEKYLEYIKNRKVYSDSATSVGSANSESYKKEYVPYTNEEFPSQNGISPKLKFSNKEKNLIKRRRYDHTINSENQNDDVVYCQFDSEINSEINSDKNSDRDST